MGKRRLKGRRVMTTCKYREEENTSEGTGLSGLVTGCRGAKANVDVSLIALK